MATDEDDFATLFAASEQARQFGRGQTISGTIVAIGHEVAFVDVGGKGEAVVDIAELSDESGVLEVAVGDRIEATVVSTDGGLTLSRRLARGAVTDRQVSDAFRAGLPVDGKVEREVKGGYEVRVGRQRGFCPLSQIDIVRTTDPAVHVGRVYTFRIIELKNDGKDLVVSRRALLQEERQASADAVRRSVVAGAIVQGRVVSIRDFGAFIDLGGGVQGLLHVSDMGWTRVSDASQFVSVGEELSLKVLRVDESTQKIALGLKQLTDDPWSLVASTTEIGQIRHGRVTRVAEFGAFVELDNGVEALAHVSTFQPTGKADGWKAQVPVGLVGQFQILSIDVGARRIGVALVGEGVSVRDDRAGDTIGPGARVVGTVERHEPFGVFVFLAPGRTGLMPFSETGVSKDADVAKTFPIGSEIEVVVLEVDSSGRRIRVSRKAVLDAQDADELRAYQKREQAESTSGAGSMAEKLRSALEAKGRR